MDGSKLVYRQITIWTFCCLHFMEIDLTMVLNEIEQTLYSWCTMEQKNVIWNF